MVNEFLLGLIVRENSSLIPGENNSWPVFTSQSYSGLPEPPSPENQKVNTKKKLCEELFLETKITIKIK
jgi:hypothetical protein